MKFTLFTLLFLVGCSDMENIHEYNAKRVGELEVDLEYYRDKYTDCQVDRSILRVENSNLESKLSNQKEADAQAKYKAASPVKLSDLVSGNKFLVDNDPTNPRIFLKLDDNRYTFVIDDEESNEMQQTLMREVKTVQEAFDYAKENSYRRIK